MDIISAPMENVKKFLTHAKTSILPLKNVWLAIQDIHSIITINAQKVQLRALIQDAACLKTEFAQNALLDIFLMSLEDVDKFLPPVGTLIYKKEFVRLVTQGTKLTRMENALLLMLALEIQDAINLKTESALDARLDSILTEIIIVFKSPQHAAASIQ